LGLLNKKARRLGGLLNFLALSQLNSTRRPFPKGKIGQEAKAKAKEIAKLSL
jgi:hypothetical protein